MKIILIDVSLWHLFWIYPVIAIVTTLIIVVWISIENKFNKDPEKFDPIEEANQILNNK